MDAPDESKNTPSEPRLLDQLRDCIRLKHYSIRTDTQYVHWARRYIIFHQKRHSRDLGAAEVGLIRDGKGAKDRVTMLPEADLRAHLVRRR
ncbi:phage integrase N-terminal SAM-like domain-containing protein [Accumulibacter sp.]|uniref:phage integrase N-terminal SAM-like domain-containing protein n=1 Tax=Accumulibacter sp. TaxID=2053492 RepID=UPI00342D0321